LGVFCLSSAWTCCRIQAGSGSCCCSSLCFIFLASRWCWVSLRTARVASRRFQQQESNFTTLFLHQPPCLVHQLHTRNKTGVHCQWESHELDETAVQRLGNKAEWCEQHSMFHCCMMAAASVTKGGCKPVDQEYCQLGCSTIYYKEPKHTAPTKCVCQRGPYKRGNNWPQHLQ
jgi:hypothetical protein